MAEISGDNFSVSGCAMEARLLSAPAALYGEGTLSKTPFQKLERVDITLYAATQAITISLTIAETTELRRILK